ncbi:MAG: immunoglobulin domain-containing protein [Opitutales bacterium]|jgi:hypothetical protein
MSRCQQFFRLAALLALLSGVFPLLGAPTSGVAPVLQPVAAGYNALLGQRFQFSVTVVIGTTPLHYQWLNDGKTIAGANSAKYQIAKVSPASAGNYSVTVKNAYGSATAYFGYLAVHGPPVVITQPQATPALIGYGALLGVVADNSTTTFQWIHNGQPVPNSNTNVMYLGNVSTADAGTYSVVLSNPWGNTTSKTVALTVKPDPHPGTEVPGVDGCLIENYKVKNGVPVTSGIVEVSYYPQVASVNLLGVQTIGGVVNIKLASHGPYLPYPYIGYYDIPFSVSGNVSGSYIVTVDGRLLGPPFEGLLD